MLTAPARVFAAASLLNPACSTHDCAVPGCRPRQPRQHQQLKQQQRQQTPMTLSVNHPMVQRCVLGCLLEAPLRIVFAQPCQSAAPSLPACCQQAGCAGVAISGLLHVPQSACCCTHVAAVGAFAWVAVCRCTSRTCPWRVRRRKSGHWPRQ